MSETKQLTKAQLYRKEYDQRPEVIEKRRIANSVIKECECGGMYSMTHRKQHNEENPIHLNWMKTGEKMDPSKRFILPDRIYKYLS
jgi:hypothetical protein